MQAVCLIIFVVDIFFDPQASIQFSNVTIEMSTLQNAFMQDSRWEDIDHAIAMYAATYRYACCRSHSNHVHCC